MSWGSEQGEKFKEVTALAFTILLDCAYVAFVAYITELLKFVIEEYIIHSKLNSTGNHELKIVYLCSQILVISLSVIYVVIDIIRHLLKGFKSIKK